MDNELMDDLMALVEVVLAPDDGNAKRMVRHALEYAYVAGKQRGISELGRELARQSKSAAADESCANPAHDKGEGESDA